MFHSKRKLFRRKNRSFLLCLFILIKIFLFVMEANIEMEEKAAHCSAGSDLYTPVCWFPPQADTEPPPMSRAHSLCVTAAGDGDACPGGTAMSTKLPR